MKRINVSVLLVLVGFVFASGVGIVLLNRYQVSRNAGALATRARTKLAEGKTDEALRLFAKYVGLRPGDADAYAEFATLVLERAEAPGASRADFSRAFSALETAVRRDPGNDALRMKLAEFDVRIGRFNDARDHLDVLRTRAAAAPAAGEAGPAVSPVAIEVLRSRAFAGTGQYTEAARIASDLVGFNLETKAFDDAKQAGAGTTEAYTVLAAILEEKFKDREAASRVIGQLVKANKDDPRAWLAAARWHRQHNDAKAAAAAIARAEALNPDDADTILMAFEIAVADKDRDRAAKVIAKGLEKHPDDERVYRGRALLAMQENNPADAMQTLRDGLARLPNQPGLLLMLADLLLQQQDIPEVEATIGTLADVVGPTSPAVGLLEARVLLQQRKWMPAKLKLDQVRPLVAGSEELTRQVDLYLGQCYEQLGQFDEQLEANRRVLSDDPGSLAARVGAASALIAAGKPDEALAEFETVAAAIPADRLPAIPQVWSPLLQLRVGDQMKREPADRDWTRVDALLDVLQGAEQVSEPQMALLRADVLIRKGEADAASGLLEKTIGKHPDAAQLWAALAQMTLRQQGPEKARAVISRIPAAVADDPAVLLVDAQVAAREPTEARKRRLAELETKATALPADRAARLLSGLASIRIASGDRDEAERLWKLVVEKAPDDLQVRTALYEVARDGGDVEKTAAAAKEIARLAGPTSPQARVADAGEKILRVRTAQKKKIRAEQTAIDLSAAEKELLNEARNLLIEAENDRPGWSQIQQMFAEVEGLRGDTAAAIDRLQRAVRLGPANPAVVRQLVALLYASNRLEEAQQALAQLGPEGVEGTERITAEMEMRAGKFEEAVALAERSVSRDSTDPNDLLWLGQLLSRSGAQDRAEEAFERAVQIAPTRPETWMALFSHQVSTGRQKQASRTLGRAEAALPEPQRQLVAAQGNELLGDAAAAERDYRSAIEAAPDDLNVARSMAAFLLRRGRLNPARDALQRIIDSAADDAAARGAKAWARRTLAELTASRGGYRSLEAALEILQQNAGSDGTLPSEDVAVKIAMLAGRPEPASWRQALGALESLARTQPLSTAQRLQRAELREKTGRWEDCRNDLVSMVAAPNAPPALYAVLIEKLIAHDELSTARTWLGKLRTTLPEAPITLALEAKLAIAEKDRPTAVAAAKKLMPKSPVPAEQVGQLRGTAKLMEDLGFPKAADKLLAEFAAQSPDGVIARAEFLGRQKRIDEALDLIQQSWDALPLERVLQTALVVVRAQGTRPTPAIVERLNGWFGKAKRQDPDSIVVLLLMAELEDLQGNTEKVETIYRDLLARTNLQPTQGAIVANNLAFHLAAPETSAEALTLVDRAIAELGPHPDLLDTRGVVLLADGKVTRALDDLQEAVLAPSATKFLHLAAAQLEARQPEAAKRSLAKARSLGLDPDQLPTADRARLEKIEAALSDTVAGA